MSSSPPPPPDEYEELARPPDVDPLAQTVDSGPAPSATEDRMDPFDSLLGPPAPLEPAGAALAGPPITFQSSADSSGAVLPNLLTDPAQRRKRWVVLGAAGAALVALFVVVFVLALPDGDEAGDTARSAGAPVDVSESADAPEPGEPATAASPTMAPAAAGEFVIEDEPVPEAVQKMNRLRRRVRAQKQRRLASRLHARRHYDRAETWWRRSLVYHRESSEGAAGLARTLAAQDKSAEAMAWAREAVAQNPRSSRAREVMGDLLVAQGDVEGAIEQYEAGLAANRRSRRLKVRLRRARQQR